MRVRCFPFVEPFSPKLAANAMPPKSKKPRQAESDPAEPRGSDGADILHLARKHFASRSAVVDVLKAVERDGMPKHFSRATQYDRRKKFAATRTMYGPLVCSILLHGVVIAVQSPAAMLVHCSENCRGFRKLLQDTYDRHGANAPWSLILYADGVSPADTMSKNDQRTFYAVYWSFQEFGPAALATEEVWFTLAVMRTTLLEQIPGGLSHVLRTLFEEFFFNPAAGIDFERSGVLLRLASGVAIALCCTLAVAIADEPALKDMFCAKGHQGLRCCMLCRNIIQARYWDEGRDAGNVRHTCRDFRQFKKHTDQTIRAALAKLDNVPGPRLEEAEKLLGFNHVPRNFARHPSVKVASILMWDWMHLYLVGGLLAQELGWTMAGMRGAFATMGEFVGLWTWPFAQAGNFAKLFTKKAAAGVHAVFNATASELLSLTPVLGVYFASAGAAAAGAQVQSLLACVDVVELLCAVKLGVVTVGVLREAINRHVELRLAAYGAGVDDAALKAHATQHLADMLDEHGTLYNCFVLERHHRLLTKYGWEQNNTKSYELGILEQITVEQTADLDGDWL